MQNKNKSTVAFLAFLTISLFIFSGSAWASESAAGAAHSTWSPVFGLTGLLALAVLMFPFANRLRFPYTVMLAIVGGLLGIAKLALVDSHIPFISDFFLSFDSFEITSDLVFFVFLPALVFESALSIDVRRLMEDIAPILFLAIVGLVVSTAIVGFVMHAIVPFSLVVCLLLGAIVSATDPVAVVAIFKDLGAPKRLAILVEGESLFNDATAIVAFTLLSGMLLGEADSGVVSGSLAFLKVFIGGILVGYILARLFCMLFGWLGEIPIAKTTLSITLAYLSFIVAEHFLHVSGVMAVVTAALVIGSQGRSVISPSNWHSLHEVWEQLGFMANSIIFLLVGLAVPVIMRDVSAEQWGWLAILLAAGFAARAVIIFGMLPLLIKAKIAGNVSTGYRAVMFWGGLRGAVSLALALAVMENSNFDPEIRSFIGMLVCGFVLFTLFVNATTVQFVMKMFGLDKLSDTDTAIKEKALAQALLELGDKASKLGEITATDAKYVSELRSNITERKLSAEQALQAISGLQSNIWSTLGLKTAAQKEMEIYSRMLDQGLISSDSARRLFANTNDLIDGVKANGREGYQDATDKCLALTWQTKSALWLQRKCNISGPLAKQLARRFEDLCSMVIAQRELSHSIGAGISEMLDSNAVEKVEQELALRLEHSEREQQAMRSAYPDYAAALERRMFAMAVSRMEANEYNHMAKGALISSEVKGQLLAELEDRTEHFIAKPVLDLGLDTHQLVSKVPMFTDLDDAVQHEIAALLKPRLLLPGETLMQAGEIGDAMYFISTGAVRVKLDGQDVTLGSGDFVGEVALLSDLPRNADVVSDAYSDVLVLLTRDFKTLMDSNATLRATIEEIAQARAV